MLVTARRGAAPSPRKRSREWGVLSKFLVLCSISEAVTQHRNQETRVWCLACSRH